MSAAVDPLPLEPATWNERNDASGPPEASSSFRMRSRRQVRLSSGGRFRSRLVKLSAQAKTDAGSRKLIASAPRSPAPSCRSR